MAVDNVSFGHNTLAIKKLESNLIVKDYDMVVDRA